MAIITNPGAGDCETGTYENAYNNIKQFIKDCEAPMHIVESDHEVGDDGRFRFMLRSDEVEEFRIEVTMPGLPLKEVRYLGKKPEHKSLDDTPRLYVDGSSWWWPYALVTKDILVDYLREQYDDHLVQMEELKEKLISLSSENKEVLDESQKKQFVQKVGKGFAVEIPSECAENLGVEVGDMVTLIIKDNKLILEKYEGR